MVLWRANAQSHASPPHAAMPSPHRRTVPTMPTHSANGAMPTPDKALAYVESHRDPFLDDLKDLLRIPSISTLPEHRDDTHRAAQYVADQLTAIGMKKVRLIQPLKDGHPLVYGEWLEAKDKPTILLYGHYDV